MSAESPLNTPPVDHGQIVYLVSTEKNSNVQEFTIYNSCRNALALSTNNLRPVVDTHQCLVGIFERVINGSSTRKLDINDDDFIDAYKDILEVVNNSDVKHFEPDELARMVKESELSEEDLANLYFNVMDNTEDEDSTEIVDLEFGDIYRELTNEIFIGQELNKTIEEEESDLNVDDAIDVFLMNFGETGDKIVAEATADLVRNSGVIHMLIAYPKKHDLEDNYCVYTCYKSLSQGARNFAKIQMCVKDYNRDQKYKNPIEFAYRCYTFELGKKYLSNKLELDKNEFKRLKNKSRKVRKNLEIDEDEERTIHGTWMEVTDSDLSSDEDEFANLDDLTDSD